MLQKIKNALISVNDKEGLSDVLKVLKKYKIKPIKTTYGDLNTACRQVSATFSQIRFYGKLFVLFKYFRFFDKN